MIVWGGVFGGLRGIDGRDKLAGGVGRLGGWMLTRASRFGVGGWLWVEMARTGRLLSAGKAGRIATILP
ncbi:hypothetical protein AB0M36_19295 [Actinoplanes sp. NPDC051346]|uniref:hypothetical protein n=1 Tax=Actinoplanes sp. NPDC051346 TaxID=3155048 RepID=UPI0034286D11